MSNMGHIHQKMYPDLTSIPDFASILIVEDQRFDRTRLKRLIDALDFDTHVAEAETLERMGTMLQLDKFDLILLDFNLQDGTGLQGLGAARLDPKNRNAAVIMITGDGQSEIAIEALKRGCSDYITKDDLSPDNFRRATINALQKPHLSIGIETQDSKRQQIEEVLQRFSSECAHEIKPVVSRMMRQLRDLRDAPNLPPDQMAERHARIEQSCMRLWDFLNDLDEYQGTDITRNAPSERMVSDNETSASLARAVPKRVTAKKGDPFPVEAPQTAGNPTGVVPTKPRRIFGRPMN